MLLFPILWLAGCGTCEPLTRTETVEVKVPVLVRLDPKLTERPAEPRLKAGPVTNDDLANLIDELRAWGRGLAGKLREIQKLQPKAVP